MIIKCPVTHLNTLNKAYREKLIANGEVGNGYLYIRLAVANTIRKEFGKEPVAVNSCCGGKKLPPLTTQAKNFAGAMGRVIGATVNGFPIKRGESEQNTIWEICRQCPHFIPEKRRCELCGCKLNWKIQLETEKCPKALW